MLTHKTPSWFYIQNQSNLICFFFFFLFDFYINNYECIQLTFVHSTYAFHISIIIFFFYLSDCCSQFRNAIWKYSQKKNFSIIYDASSDMQYEWCCDWKKINLILSTIIIQPFCFVEIVMISIKLSIICFLIWWNWKIKCCC